MPSHKRVAKAKDPSRALVEAIALDIGKEMVAYLEVMYPDATITSNSGMRLSVRNHIYNDIMWALETTDEKTILERLERRRKHRREWLKTYRDYRKRDRANKLPTATRKEN